MPRFLKQQKTKVIRNMIWDRSRSERQGLLLLLLLLFYGYRSDTKHTKQREIKRQTGSKNRQEAGGNLQIVLHLFIRLSWGGTHVSRIWKFGPKCHQQVLVNCFSSRSDLMQPMSVSTLMTWCAVTPLLPFSATCNLSDVYMTSYRPLMRSASLGFSENIKVLESVFVALSFCSGFREHF